MSDYQPTGKHYEIKTIEELATLVTPENLDLIMTDLRNTFDLMHKVDDFSRISCESVGIQYEKVSMPTFNWIDDGKTEIKGFTIQGSGDPALKFEMKQEGFTGFKPEGK